MKTLFQSWCEENEKAPLPTQYQNLENPFLQALKLAEVRTSTFQQRQARRVRTWFESHPECKHELLPLDWRDEQLRSAETAIDTESRAGRGWFDKVTGVRVVVDSRTLEIHEEERPEHRLSEVDSFDKSLEMAAAMNSPAYKREIENYEAPAAPYRKLSNEQIRELLHRRRQGETFKVLAAEYGITVKTIFNYKNAYDEIQQL